mmetsp:Transcript_23034/g.61182  ORF Transcript_23034/g.61182 Transcript_23034/m.61182 type:complete len:206 (-) Transcript_23034:4666-5283(-)
MMTRGRRLEFLKVMEGILHLCRRFLYSAKRSHEEKGLDLCSALEINVLGWLPQIWWLLVRASENLIVAKALPNWPIGVHASLGWHNGSMRRSDMGWRCVARRPYLVLRCSLTNHSQSLAEISGSPILSCPRDQCFVSNHCGGHGNHRKGRMAPSPSVLSFFPSFLPLSFLSFFSFFGGAFLGAASRYFALATTCLMRKWSSSTSI